ncbi:MAG: FtsW/RodA/SpoVE family cell cycle protein, partial [Verrucomicrobiota bacterium]
MFERDLNERKARLDWPLILALLGLMVIGAAFIYSATSPNEILRSLPWYKQLYVKQIAAYVLGLTGAALLCLVEYHRIARWSLVFYWLTIASLVAVLLPFIGTQIFGARRWIDLGFIQLQ